MEAATDSKTAVEEAQREQRRKMEETSAEHKPRWFVQNKEGRWEPNIEYVRLGLSCFSIGLSQIYDRLPQDDPQAAAKVVSDWIFASLKVPLPKSDKIQQPKAPVATTQKP